MSIRVPEETEGPATEDEIEKVCLAVLKQITPDRQEREEIRALAGDISAKVSQACKELEVEARVRLEGSVAKDTWLREEPDIDIFMRVSRILPRNRLGEVCLEVARKATKGLKQVERFAEHPYLEAFVDGTRVNIVPCYDTKKNEWQSATDRTPFHTNYINRRLGPGLKGEVRLLKRFMKGTEVYGAEIKTGGFSGYLCELLILHYGSFAGVLRAFAHHKGRIMVDLENHYRGRQYHLDRLFKEPLVVVDPVDRMRNVASAVQSQKLCTFVAASQAFLKRPVAAFFCPKEIVPLTVRQLRLKLARHELKLAFVHFGNVGVVPDVLWGQLYKSQRSLAKLLSVNDFSVLRHAAWSDEKNFNVFVFELEQRTLPQTKKHLGPPLEKERECESFLKKYLHNPSVVSGPYIEDSRWTVEISRKCPDAVDLLNGRLKDGGKGSGVAESISRVLRKEFRVLVSEEIADVYEKNKDFARFLTQFLLGRPKWLETSEA